MNLPDDIMLNIFEYLTIEELLKVANVSKYWQRLANQGKLWERQINRMNCKNDAKEIYKKFFIARKDKKIVPGDQFYLVAPPISILKFKNHYAVENNLSSLSILSGSITTPLDIDSIEVEMEKRNIKTTELIKIFNNLVSIKLFVDYNSAKKYTSQFDIKNSKGLIESQAPIFKVKIIAAILNQEIRPRLASQRNEALIIEIDMACKKYIKPISVLLNDCEIKFADEKKETKKMNRHCGLI